MSQAMEPGERRRGAQTGDDRRLPLVILNTHSGQGRSRSLRTLLDHSVRMHGAELVETSEPGSGYKLAYAAARDERPVVAVGGDGTISEIAGGILSSGARVPLGIVPAGNGNDYAYGALGLPRETRAALDVAFAGPSSLVDVGTVNSRIFVNALGVGIDANVAAAAESLKRVPFLRGQGLYWASSLRELVFHYHRCPALHVSYDDSPPERQEYALADVTIGPRYGGGFRINPGADPNDGLLDLCLIQKPGRLRALRLLPMVERGAHIGQPEVSQHLIRTVTMEADGPVFAHLDGEVIRATRFEARILPRALLVRRP